VGGGELLLGLLGEGWGDAVGVGHKKAMSEKTEKADLKGKLVYRLGRGG